MTTGLNGFTESDLARLAELAGCHADELGAELRRKPWRLGELLSDPTTDEAVTSCPRAEAGGPSPYLLFAVLTHRAAAEIREASYVNDWTGPRMRLPVFDVEPLQEFAEETRRLLFLAGLLATFSTPSAIALPVPADSLDLHELARWLDVAMPSDRAALLRHLGDVALFLGGVFPDRTGPQAVTVAEAERLGESAGLGHDEIAGLLDAASPAPGLDAIDSLGPRWYDQAARQDAAHTPPIVRDVAARFRAARRFLNHVADRYLYPVSYVSI
jgi:hypothetical protein